MPFQLIPFTSPDALARAAAGDWLDAMQSARSPGRPFCVALSGGRITQTFFRETVAQARSHPASLDQVEFFWADERCVPPGDPDSNFKLAEELLFAPLKIPASQVHRLRGEISPPEAVKLAQAELEAIAAPRSGGQPVLDLILLGMGEDGHVASLFPNATRSIWDTATAFLVVEDSPKPPPTRISLSLAAIAAARQVWVLASGSGKAQALRASLNPAGQTPLARVLQARSATKIYSDILGI